MNTVSLDDIRLFVAVVQAGSLSSASDLTGIPVSRLSRRLTQLEKTLGTQLLNRGKKGVSLNDLGERFFVHAQNMLSQAQIAIESIHTTLDKPSGLLKISAPVDLYHHVLAERLDEYLSHYPDVNLDINATQQKINMIQDGVDIALRVGSIMNDNVVARPLFMMDFGIFATQEYLDKHGTPATPHELYQHQVIGQSLSMPWKFDKQGQTVKITPASKVAGNDFLLIEQMINKGMGIGMLPRFISDKYPNLVQVLSDWQIPQVPVSMIYYKNRGAVPAVRSFVEWLAQSLGNQSA
ncbi:LysR family transcriptional regulator [Moraxella pluranimalium]|uniref:LysR family transcriptional regulator n=1 Tax=Moraxella pluranimalium TaxID=470453 RepID=A0A1T0CTF6_9GAMM|nr:LysR family transcriptional regulator [Moraxella pluranimalium]OOS25640.1 LysR family transcriptional regulator [Moraxella pluranimalium]